jgi:hypothetical protein
MRHPGPDGVQPGRGRGRIQLAQIVYFDFIFPRGRKYLLAALGQNNAPEHLVPVDDSLQGGLETAPIPIFHVHFGVPVAGNIAQLNPFRPADQIGLLEIGEGKRFKAIPHIRLDRGETCVLFRGGLPLGQGQTKSELCPFFRSETI